MSTVAVTLRPMLGLCVLALLVAIPGLRRRQGHRGRGTRRLPLASGRLRQTASGRVETIRHPGPAVRRACGDDEIRWRGCVVYIGGTRVVSGRRSKGVTGFESDIPKRYRDDATSRGGRVDGRLRVAAG